MAPEPLSVSSPSAWDLSERMDLSDKDDWRRQFKLEGLAADTQYECERFRDAWLMYRPPTV